MKKKSLMKKIYDSKAFWIVISLLVSISIWIYVTDIDKEEHNQTFYGVRVELEGENILKDSRNLVITDLDTNTVNVNITGPRRVVGSLSSADLVAKIDVSKLSQAAYTSQPYYISFPDGIDKSGIKIVRTTPNTVNFMVSQLVSKPIQVRGAFEGKLAENHTAETPVFEPSTITVSGAESYLKNVEYAWVNFGKDVTVDSSYSVDSPVKLMDAEGKPCSMENLILSNETVRASLPLLEIKDIALGIDIIEGAGATKANTKIKIEPASITLAGDSAILAGINKIILGTVDLTDFASTFSETYTIPLDNELKNLTGVSEAKVSIEIPGLETRSYKVKNISYINAAEGQAVEILSESIDVTIRGESEELDKIKAENLRAVVDLTDFKDSTGTYMPEAKIYVGDSITAGAIGKAPVSIEIRKA